MENKFLEMLKMLQPYVIVTGSYATGKQTVNSDIDFYIKFRPDGEYDPEIPGDEETYIKEIIKIIEQFECSWGSVFTTSLHTDYTPIKLEFSAYYQIDENNIFDIEILGITFQASKSLYIKE